MNSAISLVAHAVAGWAVCGSTIVLGRQFLSMQSTLVIHAIVAPLTFGLLSWSYFRRFADASPLKTATMLTGVVIGLDVFLVAPLFERSYEMFRSLLGTWIPFASMLTASYVVGRAVGAKGTEPARSESPPSRAANR